MRSEENIPGIRWKKSDAQVFWGEIAPCDHVVQFYENDDVILDSIEGFVVSGFNAGDSVIIIASSDHLTKLDARLKGQGFNVDTLRRNHQFVTWDADQALAQFMVNNWPDTDLFMSFIREVVRLAQGRGGRQVRAYGEMVAILWGQGHSAATVQLEHLWNKFCAIEAFCLFCAYPKAGFTQDLQHSIDHICSTHSKVLAGDVRSATEIFYKDS